MKLRHIFFIVLCISFISVGTASAFGLPGLGVGSSSAAGDPDEFLKKAQTSEKLIDASAQSMFNAVASKEDQARVEEIQKKMNETSDPKEKNALQREVTKTELAAVQERANNEELKKDAANWDAKKKEHVSSAFYNYALGALQAALLVPEGNNIVKSIKSNPVNAAKLATKLDSVTGSVTALGGIAGNSAKVIGALKTLMSAANIQIKLPTTASEKPKEIEGGI